MTVQIPTGFAAISYAFKHTLDPDLWWTTMGNDVDQYDGDLQAIGNKALQAWWGPFQKQLSTSVSLLGVQVKLGDDSSSPPLAFIPFVGSGTNTSSKLPQNCALLVKKQSAQGGRQHRGRMFLPGILTEEEVDAVGTISDANFTSLSTDATVFFGNLNIDAPEAGPPMPMVILHNTPPDPAPLPTPVTHLTVDRRISTQRRRLR